MTDNQITPSGTPLVPKPGDALSHSIDDYPDGIILVIDKPYRWTSADVIRKIKYDAIRHFGKKNLKVGHAGTLDPLATGILLVCIGKATKLAQELQNHGKEYLASISFGATTPSYDLEKEIDTIYSLEGVSREALESAIPSFCGEIDQVAPLFSAKSVDGVRAYETARKLYRQGGLSEKDNILQTSRIRIDALEVEDWLDNIPLSSRATRDGKIKVADVSAYHLPTALVRVRCSKGTYIRALARDLGEALGSGAFLSDLRRTASGPFNIGNSLTIGEAVNLFQTPQR